MARLMPILNSSENFGKLQSAYRSKHSTETALLKIFDDCYKVMDEKRGTVLITLDISAAFDTIVHDVLLNRLERCFGISGSFLKWIQSYLSNRRQFIKVGNCTSAIHYLTAGVPQGSVLGPLLFCAYVSTLSSVIPEGILFHQYADDTQLYCAVSVSDFEADVRILEECTKDIEYWFLQNGMLLNADKSDAVLLSTPQQAKKLSSNAAVSIAGTSVVLSDSVRNLGVIIDKSLSLDKQIKSVCSSCYFHMKAFRHIRPALDDETARDVARCIVMSRIDYCNSLYFGLSKKNINKLQRIQNSLARLVLRAPFRSLSIPLLMTLHWLPVELRIRFKVALVVFKCRNKLAPIYLEDLLSDHVPTRSLRSSGADYLCVPRVKTVVASRAFSSAGPFVWNDLPSNVRTARSVELFKRNLKTFLFAAVNY